VTSLTPPTWHLVTWVLLAGVVSGYVAATSDHRYPASRTERLRFTGAMAVAVVACGWPLGDLAAHVSLTALVVQRLALMLAVAPLLLSSIPMDLAVALTRPASVDRVAEFFGRPLVAIATVTVLGTATLIPVVVGWGSANAVADATFDVVTVALGVVLWIPILGTVPGSRRLSLVAKGGYLMVSSLVVTSLSLVWIFAAHPLYPSLHGQRLLLGISPLTDQQLAGFVAKLGAYVPMWTAAFVLFAKSGPGDPSDRPLRWIDVERELERADRRAHVAEGHASR
jgi:cytochrome c oxidase assembly factor CtaG